MRHFLAFLLISTVLAGCMSIDAVVLKHPETGEIVQCGPHSGLGRSAFAVTAQLQRGCIQDFKEQGFQRVTGSG